MFDEYPKYEYPLAAVQLILFMIAMGATLKPNDFTPVFRQPRDLVYGLCVQLLLLPVVALLFNQIFGLTGGIALGLVLVGALPGGTLSNVFTYFSRGNVALSIALSASATLLCIVTIPLMLRLLASSYVPPDFHMPVLLIVRDILLFLLLPLAIGMVIGRYVPNYKKQISRWCLIVGLFLIFIMVVGSTGSGRIHVNDYPLRTALAIILFCFVSQQIVMLPYRLRREKVGNNVALGLEVTVRNINLGLLLKSLLFPAAKGEDPIGDGVLFVSLFYGAVMMFVALPLSLRIRRAIGKIRREEAG